MKKTELIDELGETVGEKKAGDLVEEAMAETGLNSDDLDNDEVMEVLDTITEIDDSSIVNVAANCLKTQIQT